MDDFSSLEAKLSLEPMTLWKRMPKPSDCSWMHSEKQTRKHKPTMEAKSAALNGLTKHTKPSGMATMRGTYKNTSRADSHIIRVDCTTKQPWSQLRCHQTRWTQKKKKKRRVQSKTILPTCCRQTKFKKQVTTHVQKMQRHWAVLLSVHQWHRSTLSFKRTWMYCNRKHSGTLGNDTGTRAEGFLRNRDMCEVPQTYLADGMATAYCSLLGSSGIFGGGRLRTALHVPPGLHLLQLHLSPPILSDYARLHHYFWK